MMNFSLRCMCVFVCVDGENDKKEGTFGNLHEGALLVHLQMGIAGFA